MCKYLTDAEFEIVFNALTQTVNFDGEVPDDRVLQQQDEALDIMTAARNRSE